MFILVFIITILILVLIHEWGHYIVAKKSNIKVLEFAFGLPPRIWGKKIGETIFSINWLPFGGFVKLLGEDETDAEVLNDKRSFAKAPITKRIGIVVAGVVMNLLLAWVLYYIVLGAQGFKTQVPLLTDHHFVGVRQTNEKVVLIGNVATDSPALVAGIKSGDRVLSVNNQPINSTEELSTIIKQHAGKQVNITLSDPIKTETPHSVEVTPRENPPQGQGPLGVSLGQVDIAVLDYATPAQKIFAGPIHSWNLAAYSWEVLSNTVAASFAKRDFGPVSQNVAGPVGITNLVKQILDIKNPLLPYLDFMAALSLNLAIVNILPFPGLDGGRFSFLLFEAITRKKPNATFEKYYHGIGLAILLALMLALTVSDVRKLLPF